MITTYTEHNKSRNVVLLAPVVMVTICTEHTRSRNSETTFRGNHEIIGYPSCIGYYIY